MSGAVSGVVRQGIYHGREVNKTLAFLVFFGSIGHAVLGQRLDLSFDTQPFNVPECVG